jgi:hypothetical protein
MMHVTPCEQVREDLTAFHDGELSIDEQVLIQSHLQECVTCRLEAAALADLGDALRAMSQTAPGREAGETGRISGAVLERIRIERQFSLTAEFRGLFEDMHLVWAGLGATMAVLICVFASAGVLHAASQERPDSLAGIISTMVNADSADPVRLAGAMRENRELFNASEIMQASEQDTNLMLSAVVTPEGRIENLELLEEQARALHVKPEVVLAMLDAVSRARFEPRPSTMSTGVSVVWLVTSTTVKGLPDYDLYLVRPPRWTEPIQGPMLVPSKRAVTPVEKSRSAGDDGLTA